MSGLPEIRHICNPFQDQLVRRAPEISCPLAHQETSTSISDYR